MKRKMLEDSLNRISLLKEKENDSWEIAATIRVADILQNMDDYENLKPDLQERFLEKAKRIIREFDGKIDLVEELKKRVSELEK
jgi:hypothetical protein